MSNLGNVLFEDPMEDA